MSKYLAPIDYQRADFGDYFDELPLWSAPFGIQMLDRVPLRSDMRILDVGTGTGFLALELAQRCGPTSKVYAVDPWDTACNRLAKKIEYCGIENIELIRGVAEKLNLPNGEIDLAVCNLGINNFEKPSEVLAEVNRVSKVGATLAITTNLVGHMSEFYEVFQQTFERVFPGRSTRELDMHVAHRGTVESVSELIHEAGFLPSCCETSDYKMRFCNGTALLNHFFIRLGFMGGWRGVVGGDHEVLFFTELENDLNNYATKFGELKLTIPVGYFEATKFASLSK